MRERANRRLWSHPALLSAAQQIAYLERAAAHVLAGWIPKVVGTDTTLALSRIQHESMCNASRLLRAVRSRGLPMGGWRTGLSEGWRCYAAAVDRSASEPVMLWSVFAALKRRAEALVVAALLGTDTVLDANIQEQLALTLRSLRHHTAWHEARHDRVAPENHVRELNALWDARDTGALMDARTWLWAPVDRVLKPRRPSDLTFAQRGSMSARAIFEDNAEHTREMFHGMFDEEIATLELFARSSYEHPDMPEEFHLAMSRQMSDESRHASACLEALADLGGAYGEMPISTGVYEFHYHYGPCEAGSKRELLWRLLLRSVFEEALSLDGFVLQIKKRNFYQQSHISRILEALMFDEVFHVRSGLRWSEFLCEGDRARVREELKEAHTYDLRQTEDIRRRYVMENPESALEELAFIRMRDAAVPKRFPFSLDVTVNRVARAAAGMDEEDMALVIDWGYARR